MFLLLDEPEVYGLPPDPVVTTRDLPRMWRHAAAAAGSLVARPRSHRGRPAMTADRPSGRGARAAGAAARSSWCRRPSSSSYYGRPVVKETVWGPDIPSYLFLGGLAGASSTLAAGAHLTGHRELARAAKCGAAGAISLSMVALVHDLGRPGQVRQHAPGAQGDFADECRHLDTVGLHPDGAGSRRVRGDAQAPACGPGSHADRGRARPGGRVLHRGPARRHGRSGLA